MVLMSKIIKVVLEIRIGQWRLLSSNAMMSIWDSLDTKKFLWMECDHSETGE